MSSEVYDSGIAEFVSDESEKPDNRHRKLVEQILDDEVSQQNIREFMWNYVGHPDKQRRLAGEYPTIRRTINQIEMEYTREVYTGFSDDGDLFHVRAVSGLLTDPTGYVVIAGNMYHGVAEPVVHTSATIGGIDPHDIRLQLLDRSAMDNSPWGHCPGQWAPPYDQYVFNWRRTTDGEEAVEYREGRERSVILHPIEELYTSMDRIEAEQAELARSALALHSAAESYEPMGYIQAARVNVARAAFKLVSSTS